ncbi:universal stress protein [Limosilactobacillus fastidiosus]|uniref:Universal stress protein n=1 Tax=Limosilactobacillus fastidiosus TaxID=2759855 RepID=A0A7W3U0X5_9LACO|nr:universal stress protein [Limosilactobacillus fastidiosus]MBB1063586.1 universal stress protein [Limosilactobacillus fastidiosus]MBB1086839.1 universal stress protein [Limosilactobacillus fastidiosus]MCD7084162.1 universal stress protein [Limosilactobacillus fastidiosus]MCD7085434.1 universal stress protein [Limosilactobacillus fastidiosus]MCD7114665.1 universal stress protein [Limosilactobacillus fastidiosus]
MSYQKILVGIDGSKQSEMALAKAVDIAKMNNATLYLISVINGERYPTTSPSGFGFVDKSIYDSAVQTMNKRLAEEKQKAEKAGVKEVHTDVEIGNAKVELAEKFPKDNGIDLIVIGATGLNAIGRLIVGSTAAYTVRVAPCDVMVVKTDLDNKKLAIKESSYPEI